MLSDALYRVKLLFGDSLDAQYSVDKQVVEVKDAGMEDLLTFVNQVQKTIREEAAE